MIFLVASITEARDPSWWLDSNEIAAPGKQSNPVYRDDGKVAKSAKNRRETRDDVFSIRLVLDVLALDQLVLDVTSHVRTSRSRRHV